MAPAKVLKCEGVEGQCCSTTGVGVSMREASGMPGRAASCRFYKQCVATNSRAVPCTDRSFRQTVKSARAESSRCRMTGEKATVRSLGRR